MPCLQELVSMFDDEPLQVTKLVAAESAGRLQAYRLQPELGNGTGLLHVDVGRLRALIAVEEEPCKPTRRTVGTSVDLARQPGAHG